MRALLTPRFWLFVWGGLGAAFVVYVIIVSSVHSGDKGERAQIPLVEARDASLLTGEMADFTYAFPPRAAPDIPFQVADRTLTLADFRGKAVLVNFWATWCAPCLKELPSLDALQRDLGGDDFQVVAIASDPRGAAEAQQYLDRLNITDLTLYGDYRLQLVSAMGGGSVLPLSVLYDREGREIGRLLGEADWASPEARRLVESAMKG